MEERRFSAASSGLRELGFSPCGARSKRNVGGAYTTTDAKAWNFLCDLTRPGKGRSSTVAPG